MKKFVIGLIFVSCLRLVAFAQKRPNIIFILIDDQRYDFLSFLNHPWIKTPNIDALAKNGMYFNNAFATTSLCSPSRASILTGQYLHGHHVKDNDTPLRAELPTFPGELQKAGYTTAFMGKWHMGGESDAPHPGFNHWISFKGQGVYTDPELNIDGRVVDRKGYLTDILTGYAVDFIKENKQKSTPYLLYLSHKAVHGPFAPAPRHEGKYKDLIEPQPETFANTKENYKGKPLWVERQRNSWHGADRDFSIGENLKDFDNMVKRYSETMLAVDESVGSIAQTLDSLGELENTIIIYFSDNGYLLGEHGLIDKRVMYEESIRVPCFVHWPEVIKKSERRDEMVLNIDIGPTILELAGCKIPSNMHGTSFAGIIKGEPLEWRKDFLYEYSIDPAAMQTPTIIGLRTEKYSYMTYPEVWDNSELYDLEKDPQQKNNLLGNIVFGKTYGTFLQQVQKQNPEIWKIVKSLDDRLSTLMAEKGGSR